jgi:hypothetical protein
MDTAKEKCSSCYGIGIVIKKEEKRYSKNLATCTKCKGWGEVDWITNILKKSSSIPEKRISTKLIYYKFYKNTIPPWYSNEVDCIIKAIKRFRQKEQKRKKFKR